MSPASTEFIRRLPKIIARCSLLKALPTTTCAICTDDFICQDKLVRLPNCHHLFHRKCILPWFSIKNTCPLCRHVFPVQQPNRNYMQLRTRQQSSDTHVFYLNFHLRPLPPSNSDDSPSPMGLLGDMLVAEGYPELATRACGPFWVSVDRIQPSAAGQ